MHIYVWAPGETREPIRYHGVGLQEFWGHQSGYWVPHLGLPQKQAVHAFNWWMISSDLLSEFYNGKYLEFCSVRQIKT